MVNTEKGMEVRYTPESMEMPSFDKFAYEVRYNNVNTGQFEYYSGNVTVIPATTIYYEDSFVDLATYSSDGTKTADDWSLIGTVDTTSTQAEDRPDYYSLPAIDANNVYGYDSAYAEMSQYSLGSAKKVTVDANSYATASFEFYGTGFDIVSLTSNQTGVLVVQVFDANGEMKASRVVDTYYGYNYDVSTKKWSPSEDTSDNAIYQIPVMQVENLSYGKYRAVLTVSYYDALNNVGSTVDGKFVGDGSYDFYLDAIRIYDPAGVVSGEANETIENAYNADNEAYPTYFELRDKILKVKDYNADVTNAVANGIVYIDGMDGASIADYTSYGPNNELYLTKDNAVAFTMTAPAKSGYEVDKIHIGVKNLGGNGSVKVYDATIAADKVSAKTINTATDMYYDITALNGKTVVILNSGDAIISITNIKVTYKVATTTADEPAVAMFSISRPAAELAIMSLTTEDVEDDTTSTPEIDDTTSEPEIDDTTSTPEADDNTSSTPEDDTTTSAPETSEPEVNEPETDEPAEDDEAEDKESDAKEKLEEAIKKATEKAEKVLKQATKVAKTIGKAISKYLKSILN